MRQYSIAPARAPLPDLTGRAFDPESERFCRVHDFAPIDNYAWDLEGYTPDARAYVASGPDRFDVLLCALESTIATVASEFNGEVYRDSCLEFFLRPFADDPRYLNIEVNAAGIALIGFGADRSSRVRLPQMPAEMKITASVHQGAWWAVAYPLPFSLFRELYGRTPVPGQYMQGNFYKCDESIHPHFGSWNPIVSPRPDFHRPECFGALAFESVSER